MPAMKPIALFAAGVLAGCAVPVTHDTAAAGSLAEAESAFAAHSVREDMRRAFLAAFADEGVFVQGGWVRARETLTPLPAPPIVLEWRPVYVEAARSGDLGLSTGPWKRTPRAGGESDYGQYVSVWRREGEAWKVLVDIGIAHSGPRLWDAPLRTVVGAGSAGANVDAAEDAFEARAKRDGSLAAYGAFAAADMRFYREEAGPLQGRGSALAFIAKGDAHPAFERDASVTAASGELAFVRGRSSDPGTAFLRVWRREGAGWRIAMDVANALR
jgi:hypothetical protein